MNAHIKTDVVITSANQLIREKVEPTPAKSFHFIPPTAFYKPFPQELLQSFFFSTLYQLESHRYTQQTKPKRYRKINMHAYIVDAYIEHTCPQMIRATSQSKLDIEN